MDRAERTGLGIAIIGHAVLFTALSLSLLTTEPLKPINKPVDVVLVDEVELDSTAPTIARAAAPPAPEPAPPAEAAPAAAAEPDPPAPVVTPPAPRPPEPKPVPKPEPKPTPKPKPELKPKPKPEPKVKPAPAKPVPAKPVPAKPAPAKPAPAKTTTAKPVKTAVASPKPTNRLNGLNLGTGGAGAAPKSGGSTAPKGTGSSSAGAAPKGAPAQKASAEVKQSIRVSINNEVRGPWNACKVQGIDIDQLKTTIVFRLNEDGSLGGFTSVQTAGENESNRFQKARFEECARNAIQRAAPFGNLPRENYNDWKIYTLDFTKR